MNSRTTSKNDIHLSDFEHVNLNEIHDLNENVINDQTKESKEKIRKFLLKIIEVIFINRKQKSFVKKDGKDSDKEDEWIDFEQILMDDYEFLRSPEEQSNSEKQHIIDFYLSIINNNKPSVLTERWVIKYKEVLKAKEENDGFFNRELDYLKEEIVNVLKTLPLYERLKRSDAKISFKLYQSAKISKKFIEKPNEKHMSNNSICDLNIVIKYLNHEQLSKYFKEIDENYIKRHNLMIRQRYMSICLKPHNRKAIMKAGKNIRKNKRKILRFIKERSSDSSENSSNLIDGYCRRKKSKIAVIS